MVDRDGGPVTILVRQPIGARLLRRCHDHGEDANETVTRLLERRLRATDGSLLATEGQDDDDRT